MTANNGARRVSNMYQDGIVNFHVAPYSVDDKRIIRPANPSVFRVSDTYHQLYIDYFYDSEDYLETDSSVDHMEADSSLDYVETDSSVE